MPSNRMETSTPQTMTQNQNSKKIHGKKRSYFFKMSNVTKGEKEVNYLTITASRRSKEGHTSRKSITVFEKDLSAFSETLQSMNEDN